MWARGFKVVCENCGSEQVQVRHYDHEQSGECGDKVTCQQCGNTGEHVHHTRAGNPVTG